MNPIIISPIEMIEGHFVQYELPPEGISLLGYVVRRMHKTQLLEDVSTMLAAKQTTQALYSVAHYTAAASVTFGKLYYEPRPDRLGSTHKENDPRTGASVSAMLESIAPNMGLSCAVSLPGGAYFHGREISRDASASLRGWVNPTTCAFHFHHETPAYTAKIKGNITREIVPHVAGPWHMRAHGTLELQDSAGNVGRLILRRDATATVILTSVAGELSQQNLTLY